LVYRTFNRPKADAVSSLLEHEHIPYHRREGQHIVLTLPQIEILLFVPEARAEEAVALVQLAEQPAQPTQAPYREQPEELGREPEVEVPRVVRPPAQRPPLTKWTLLLLLAGLAVVFFLARC